MEGGAMAMSGDLRPPTSRQRAVAILVGVFVFLYVASCVITKGYGAAFFAIPVFVGFIAGLLYPEGPFMAALYALAVSLLLAIVTLQEGVVCVLFSLPVLLPMLWIGSFAGAIAVRHVRPRRARDRVVGLVTLLVVGA